MNSGLRRGDLRAIDCLHMSCVTRLSGSSIDAGMAESVVNMAYGYLRNVYETPRRAKLTARVRGSSAFDVLVR